MTKTRLKTLIEIASVASTRRTPTGEGWAPRSGGAADGVAARSGLIVDGVGIELGQDAVLDGAAQQVDLGRRRPPHLDVLHPDAVEVLACRGQGDAELVGHH